ncbi:MAG TPA: asparagine synthase (glutamine-hydrolyzing) [Terriglobales bacterium]|jgi:asparagine synthase (glutamine-hydrolysing)|nr:asparagine synthase (glutamine-hydrolyzing) [Terriglobales bacterium]
MCGICGIYQYRPGEPVQPETLGAMLHSIRHRGPDGEGMHLEPTLGLGSRRLSIIDLPRGGQPIYNEDGSVVVVFNGEIYNYRELARYLQDRGHKFSTASDTEVIVHLYEQLGDDCVQKLHGMFAFALWDVQRRRLLLARDRLGIKPLYYADRGRLVFASEIKCLFQDPEMEPRANLDALGNFLSLKYVPSPQTMFTGVASLPPGHLLTCDVKGLRIRPYWDLSFPACHNDHVREEEYADQLLVLLRDCVQSQLVSDVPFGAFLSGGVDSSTVVALMSQCLALPVRTYSVGFDGEGGHFSELRYARLVARKFHTDHHELIVRAQDLIDLAEKIVWHLDQPVAEEAALPNYMLAESAARDVKMVLTGEGGDELFAGYTRYAAEKFSSLFRLVPQLTKSLALAASPHIPGLRRPKVALHALCEPQEAPRLANWAPLFNLEMKHKLLSEDLRQTLNGHSHEQIFIQQLEHADVTDTLSRMLYVDTKLYLPDALLARGDKASMAASLEARVPLLDHRLVEFAAALPPGLKVKGLTRKYLLKKVARRLLPAEVIDRKKEGFPTPISVWFRKEARSFLRDTLSPSAVARRGLFSPKYVRQLLDDHDRGRADHGGMLWALIHVELWYRLFIDRSPAVRPPEIALREKNFTNPADPARLFAGHA